jgi:hypothetical protein
MRFGPANCAKWAFALGLGLCCAAAMAGPMLYSATAVTDVRVGSTLYSQAVLTIKFVGDTKDIQVVPGVKSTLCSGDVFFLLSKGSAALSVKSQGRTLRARFAPGQVFVALDACSGGIGFGSFTGPSGVEPAYPMAFTLGTAMTVATRGGLLVPADMSGSAWSCVGYPPGPVGALPGTPDQECLSPDPYPLQTSAGNVVVYMPYRLSPLYGDNHIGTAHRGTFSVRPAHANQDVEQGEDDE